MHLLPILEFIKLKVAIRVIVLIPDPEHALLNLPDNMALPDPARVTLANFGLHHNELILNIFLVDLRFNLLRVLFFVHDALVSSILLPVLLKVNISVLHHM